MRSASAILAVLLTACAAPPPSPGRPAAVNGSALSASCRTHLEDAAAFWGPYLELRRDGYPVVLVSELERDGHWDGETVRVRVCNERLFRHELGHVLGLGHSERGLMAEPIGEGVSDWEWTLVDFQHRVRMGE